MGSYYYCTQRRTLEGTKIMPTITQIATTVLTEVDEEVSIEEILELASIT